MEGTRNSVFKQAGRHIKRQWRTMHDEKVRSSHRKLFNQVRSVNSPFLINYEDPFKAPVHIMYPGDPAAPIEETANCRCWIMVYAV